MRRLHKSSEFDAVFAHDCAVFGRMFVVRARPNEASCLRLGIVASKKALPRAVDRNRGKRLVRETFRHAQPQMAALDVVVQLRAGLAKQENAAARRELRLLAERISAKLCGKAAED